MRRPAICDKLSVNLERVRRLRPLYALSVGFDLRRVLHGLAMNGFPVFHFLNFLLPALCGRFCRYPLQSYLSFALWLILPKRDGGGYLLSPLFGSHPIRHLILGGAIKRTKPALVEIAYTPLEVVSELRAVTRDLSWRSAPRFASIIARSEKRLTAWPVSALRFTRKNLERIFASMGLND
jgi:hypothetical protein